MRTSGRRASWAARRGDLDQLGPGEGGLGRADCVDDFFVHVDPLHFEEGHLVEDGHRDGEAASGPGGAGEDGDRQLVGEIDLLFPDLLDQLRKQRGTFQFGQDVPVKDASRPLVLGYQDDVPPLPRAEVVLVPACRSLVDGDIGRQAVGFPGASPADERCFGELLPGQLFAVQGPSGDFFLLAAQR